MDAPERTFDARGGWSPVANTPHAYDLVEYLGETLPEEPASQLEPVETRVGWWRCDGGEFAQVQMRLIDGVTHSGVAYVGDKQWSLTWTPSGKVMSGSNAYHENHRFNLAEYLGTEDPRTPTIEVHEMQPEPEPSEPVRRQVGGYHYMTMGIQPIDVIESVFSPEEIRGFYLGNMLKYTMRAGRKPGASAAEDIGKARHYAELLENYERKQKTRSE
jgi:hypothetical protein